MNVSLPVSKDLWGKAIANSSEDLVYLHMAIIKASLSKAAIASCVTFMPPDKVPPGPSYKV